MILYALVSGVSAADLFVAGILPGLLMAVGFGSRRRGYEPSKSDRRALLILA